MSNFRADFIARFRWIGGHADILGLLADEGLLAGVGPALAAPFAGSGFTKVAGVEARGFVLGTAVAVHAGAGFVAIRKAGAIHPGAKAVRSTTPDWRGNEHDLVLQRDAVADGDRVLLVDDWAQTGSQALVARTLIEACGGTYVGLSLLVDQLPLAARARLEPVVAVASHSELPPA